jgi:hypothetical protein
MKNKVFSFLFVLVLIVAGITVKPVEAGAYTTPFTTSITYQNVGTGPATISLTFYAETSSSPITITLPELAKMAGTSIYVGNVGDIANGFKGSAVMSSNQPIVATMVQTTAANSPVKVRPMSNGFTAGSDYVLVPTVLKAKYDAHSIVSVQNVDTVANDYRLVFVPVSGSSITVNTTNVPAGSTKFYDLGKMSQIPAGFNGSLQVFATKTGGSDKGVVVASAMELGIASNNAYAFEGTNTFATKIYMPSGMCNYKQQNSSYAVQNTTNADVSVTVKYSNGNDDGPYTLAAGAKRSFVGCAVNPNGFIGSAVIEASGAIVAMGKVYGGGLSTAFLGFTQGGAQVALPYVRWTTAHWADGTRQRAYIAIQNVGTEALAAGTVNVEYYDKSGNLVGTKPLPAMGPGEKSNSTPEGLMAGEFGYYDNNTFGGSAVVRGPAGAKLAVVVRIAQSVGSGIAAEDYSGMSIQ